MNAITFALLFSLVGCSIGSEILALFPVPARSHHNVFQGVILGLAEKGHKVTYVTPQPMKKPHPNVKEVLISVGKAFEKNDQSELFKVHLIILLREFGRAITVETLENEKVQEIIKSDSLHFDAILLETTFCQEPFIALSHKFNAPVIEVVPSGNFLWTYWLHGNPHDTSYIVDVGMDFTDEMTFMNRLDNTINSLAIRLSWSLYYIPNYQKIMDTYIKYPGWEKRPPMMDMIRDNITLVLENTHFSLRGSVPRSPNFKDIAGINLDDPRPLPKDLQKFIDGATHGVIYFTLGSHLKATDIMGEKIKDVLVKVFSNVKQRVLMKWDTDIPNLPSNIKVSQWFPQQDIFAHKNIRLFISHGGFLSQTESVKYGIPIIGIPIMGDQPLNTRYMVKSGFGIRLELTNITEVSLSWAINDILSNPKYKENALRYSAIFSDRPQTPKETAVYWIEYVIKHTGAHHLTPSVTKLAWYQESLIDVYATLILILSIAVIVPYIIIKKCIKLACRLLCTKKKQQTSSDQSRKKKKQ